MYHYLDNWYFGRTPHGAVRIIHYKEPPTTQPSSIQGEIAHGSIDVDLLIDADSWCSIVASVSAKGESANVDLAQFLHGPFTRT